MLYQADFHIHSCLSPCASLEMSPLAIVERARTVGLTAVALSDHNCGFNLPAFAAVCAQQGMDCLYGVEATSVEEAHVLCLFDQLDAAVEWGRRVYESLPPEPNRPDRFGDQPIIDENEEILGFADKFLISASDYDIGSMVKQVHALDGLCIPAHIDRQVFGMIAQLGFLPDEPFDAVEITPSGRLKLAGDYPVVRNSDAHDLATLGSASTELDVPALTVDAIRSFLWPNRMQD
jgi:PHP family Zn ribbon phosphoesterase